MEREVIWVPSEEPGLEHLRLVTSDGDVVANGLVIGLEGGRPFRIGYEVRCDGRWRVREIRAPRTRGGRSSSCSPTERAAGRDEAENLYPSSAGASTSTSRRHLSPTPSLSAGSGLSLVNPRS